MDPIIKQYIDLVTGFTNVPYKLICSKSRKEKIKEARHILIYVLYFFAKTTKRKAGIYVNRSHASAIRSISKVEIFLETDKLYRAKYSDFLNGLKSLDKEKEAEKQGIHIFKKGDHCLFWNHINEEPVFGILQEIDKAGKLAYAEDHFAPFRHWELVNFDNARDTIHIKRSRKVFAS